MSEHRLAYEAAWTVIKALDAATKGGTPLHDCSSDTTPGPFFELMRSQSFPGISGQVKFDENGDRLSTFSIVNIAEGDVAFRQVGLVDTASVLQEGEAVFIDPETLRANGLIFIGGETQAPRGSVETIDEDNNQDNLIFVVLAAVVVVVAISVAVWAKRSSAAQISVAQKDASKANKEAEIAKRITSRIGHEVDGLKKSLDKAQAIITKQACYLSQHCCAPQARFELKSVATITLSFVGALAGLWKKAEVS